jgi:plasmid stabilization system protein ParE
MAYKISITPTAFNDLQHAIDYYELQQKGLGKRFYNAATKRLATLKNTPTAGSYMYDTVRFRTIDKFPYIALYEIINNTVFIYRVFNTNQNPYWL